MWRWLLFILVLLLGMVAIAFGLYVEVQVQFEVGDWHGMANWLWGGEIRYYRQIVFTCLTAGPALLFLAYLLRPGKSARDPGVTRKTEPWSRS